MDAASLAIALLREICNITVFIKEVYTDTKNYETDRDEIAFKLAHELLLLRFFGQCFFDHESGLGQDRYLAKHILFYQTHVQDILFKLKSILEAYGKIAEEHFNIDIKSNTVPQLEFTRATAAHENNESWPRFLRRSDSFKSKFTHLKNSLSWALFEKSKLTELVGCFKEYTDRLKEIFLFATLDASRLRGENVEIVTGSQAMNLGLANGIRRQQISLKLQRRQNVEMVDPLSGQLEPAPDFEDNKWSALSVSKYRDGASEEILVAIEHKRYRPADIAEGGSMTREQRDYARLLRERIQALATVLQDPFDDDDGNTLSSELGLHTFKCLGYMDRPSQGRLALVFKLPYFSRNKPPVTLAQLIDKNWNFQLEERFFLAYTVGKTLFTLHSSNWLHKNIRSTQVIMFLTKCKGYRFTPYLYGFEYARPTEGRTDGDRDYDVVRNLYRHPKRQGYPTEDFRPIHDIYAFGVMLLEIGVKRTMTKHFAERIRALQEEGELPEREEFLEGMMKLAEKELAANMGGRYRDAVIACLKGDFGIEERDISRSKLALAFRDRVLAVLESGMAM